MTPAQTRVATLLKQGKLNKAIAHDLGIGEGTVKRHVRAMMHSRKVGTRTELVIRLIEDELGQPGRFIPAASPRKSVKTQVPTLD